MDREYEKLANEIILLAVKDYREALEILKRDKGNKSALSTKKEVEKFFRSEWYSALSNIDPEMLIRKLKEEVA